MLWRSTGVSVHMLLQQATPHLVLTGSWARSCDFTLQDVFCCGYSLLMFRGGDCCLVFQLVL
jgi:hypothetical protein